MPTLRIWQDLSGTIYFTMSTPSGADVTLPLYEADAQGLGELLVETLYRMGIAADVTYAYRDRRTTTE